MKRVLLLMALMGGLCAALPAQTYTSVTGSNITDLNGNKLAQGQICFLGTDQSNLPLSFGLSGGGQVLRRASCFPVTNGVIQRGARVPNPATTTPSGIRYRITVTDNATHQVALVYNRVALQGTTWDFDNYQPEGVSVPAPPGPANVSGPLNVAGDLSVTGSGTFGTLSVTSLRMKSVDHIRLADQWCTIPGTYDQSCFINAFGGGFQGTVIAGNHVYTVRSQIVVPGGVSIVGGWRWPAGPTFGMSTTPNPSSAPVLSVVFGAGETGTAAAAVVMDSMSGISGVEFYYPNQATSGTPAPYPWSIAFSGHAANDRVTIDNVMLVNSYDGIWIDNGGQWQIDNIYGTPLHTGIFVDDVFDGAEMHNIHFWTTFWNTGLNAWMQHHGTGLLLERADGVNIDAVEVYGYLRGLDFENDPVNGGFWGNISNFLIDGTTQPIYIAGAQQINIANGTLSGSFNAGYLWGISTGAAVGLRTNVNVTNVTAYALFGLADITSSNGTFTFSNVSGRRGSDGSRTITGNGDVNGPLVVNESNAAVYVDGTQGENRSQLAENVWGIGPGTTVDGVTLPSPGGDVTPGTWNTHFDKTFKLSDPVRETEDSTRVGPGLYIFSGTARATGVVGPAQFYLRFETGSNHFAIFPAYGFSVDGWPSGQSIHFAVPVEIGSSSALLRVVWGGGSAGTMTISGLSLHTVAVGSAMLATAELEYGGANYLDPTGAGLVLFNNGAIKGGTVDAVTLKEGGATVALASHLPLAASLSSWAPGAIAAGACTTTTQAVNGVTTSMAAAISPAADPGPGLVWAAWVSAAGTVSVRLCNTTARPVKPAAVTYNIRVVQ